MKIFNLSRFKMVEGKRFKNYLVYAIGEILLVVIGILIALYINTVQQQNRYKTNETELLNDVYAQLAKDKDDIDKFIVRVEKRNLDYAYFKSERPKQSEFPFLYELDRSPLKINPILMSSISSFSFKRSEVSLKLTELLSNYKYAQKNIARIENEMNTVYNDYTNYLGTKYQWHVGYSFDDNINTEGTDYILNNPEYKSFIARLNTISSKAYVTELEAYANLIEIEMQNIKSLLDER